MAVRYNLPTGKVVLLTDDEFWNLDDEKIQELIAFDRGIFIDDPFMDIKVKDFKPLLDIPDLELDELPEDIKKEIDKEFE